MHDDTSRKPSAPTIGGMELELARALIASDVLAAFLGDQEHDTAITDADIEPVEGDGAGYWKLESGFYTHSQRVSGRQRYRLVTTYTQRVAREAVRYADALIDELRRTAP